MIWLYRVNYWQPRCEHHMIVGATAPIEKPAPKKNPTQRQQEAAEKEILGLVGKIWKKRIVKD